jgi:4'-phosphopantetheinyl transferase
LLCRARIERAARELAPRALLPLDPDRRLLQAWVRIEAAAKAEGTGVGPLLTRLGVGGTSREANPPSVPASIEVHDLALADGLFGAVALAAGASLPAVRAFPRDGDTIERLAGGC